MKKVALLISLTFLILAPAISQTEQIDISWYIEQIIESVATGSESEDNIESAVSDLEELYANPLNINSAVQKEFDKLWILTDFQIKALLDYRKKIGSIVSLNELIYLYGYDALTVKLITPFVFLGEREYQTSNSVKQAIKYSRHEAFARITQQNNVATNYAGNNQKYNLRYKGWYGKSIKAGFLAEKDIGETFFAHDNSQGFDFYSAFIQYEGKKILESAVVGDYRIKAGQGLLIWPGYSTGKSSQINSLQRRGQGVSGNSSSDEYGYFRGSAIKVGTKKLSLTIFGSQKKLDASIDSTLMGISTIRTGGLHRTPSETAYKNSVTENLYGASLNFYSSKFQMGIHSLNVQYSHPILPSEKAYQQYNFNGSYFNGISADYKLLLQKVQLFGEVSYANNALATLNGVNLMPHPQFTTTVVYRNYKEGYFSPYSNALAEGSSVTSEEGLYLGVQWHTNWNFKLAAYTDVFIFPWARFQVNGPTEGKENLLEGVYTPNDNLILTIRYKYEQKPKNYNPNEQAEMEQLENFDKRSLRLNFKYKLSEKVGMATRYEQTNTGFSINEKSKGYLVYQDINYRSSKKLQASFRYAWFDIESFESRIYAYESNARYVYSMPAYNGKGVKSYIMLRYKLFSNIDIWLRYGHTNYFDELLQDKHEGLFQVLFKL